MESVVERLKASKGEFLNDTRESAEEVGRAWAMHQADYNALVRLEKIDLEDRNPEDSLEDWLPGQIYPDWPFNYNATSWWYNDANWTAGDLLDEQVEAFVKGALAVWEEVKHKV